MKVVPTPIWKKRVRPIDHQIVWWMLDAGVPGHVLMHGWQVEAARQLGIHRLTMRRRVIVLIEAGILIDGDKRGEVMLNTAIFNRSADRSRVRMSRVGVQ